MKPAKNVRRVGIYTRMSDDTQEGSIARQMSTCEPYCERKGWTVVKVYKDEGQKGWDTSREDFNAVLDDAKRGLIDAIVIDETSRLSRSDDTEFKALVAYPLRKAGVAVAVVAMDRVFTFAEGSLDEGLTLFLEQYKAHGESLTIGRRVSTEFAKLAKQGAVFRGKPPFGYVRHMVDGVPRLTPGAPADVDTVKFIFDQYANRDQSLSDICGRLERRGTLTPGGVTVWRGSMVRKILHDEAYTGAYVFGRRRTGRFYAVTPEGGVPCNNPERKTTFVPRAEWVVIPQQHPALVDRETFVRVQELLATRRKRTTPVSGEPFMLAKLLRCGCCGSWMQGFRRPSRNDPIIRYRCGWAKDSRRCSGSAAREDEVLPAIIRTLQQRFLSAEALGRLRSLARELDEKARSESRLDELRRERKVLAANIERATANLAILPTDLVPGVVAQIRGWQDRAALADAELADTAVTAAETIETLISEVEQILRSLDTALADADTDAIRSLLRRVVGWVSLDISVATKRTRKGKYTLRGGTVVLAGGILSSALATFDAVNPEGEMRCVQAGGGASLDSTPTCATQANPFAFPLILA